MGFDLLGLGLIYSGWSWKWVIKAGNLEQQTNVCGALFTLIELDDSIGREH